jgi:hypothetical protein
MKKIIIAASFALAISASAFAKEPSKEPGSQVKQAFRMEFNHVSDVDWSPVGTEGIYKAEFKFNNEKLQAFFTAEGEFIGTSREIVKTQLPLAIARQLDKQYSQYRIVTIFEYSKKDGVNYFVTLTGERGTQIIKADVNGDLSVYQKNIK